MAGKLPGRQGGRRDFDHDADLGLSTHFALDLVQHLGCLLDLREIGDHRKYDGQFAAH